MLRIFYSPIFKEHRPQEYHPERLEIVINALKMYDLWENITEPYMASVDELLEGWDDKELIIFSD